MIGKLIDNYMPCYIHIATDGLLGILAKIYCDANDYRYSTLYNESNYMYSKWFHRHSDNILALAGTIPHKFRKRFKDKITIWHCGVDIDIFSPDLRIIKDHKTPVLLCVSDVVKGHNLDEFCGLKIQSNKIIVGDGPYRVELESKYPNVQFAGNKSKSELAKYYANSDVLVFTSNIDINGTTLLESIASGTPVVAHPTPLAIDIVDDGITGYLGNLDIGIDKALTLDRVSVYNSAIKWSLDQCWETFKYNLVANI